LLIAPVARFVDPHSHELAIGTTAQNFYTRLQMQATMETEAIPPLLAERSEVPLQPSARPWLLYAVVFLAVLTAFCVARALRPVPSFPYDDPYITLHSAQVMHSGVDPNYPGVPALFGVTSAPFVGMVYLLLFALPPLQALNAACWTGLLLYALSLVRLGRVLELRPREQWLLVLIGLFSAPIPIHWLNGLETSCALACITWTLSFASGRRRLDFFAAAAFASLSASFRPDLVPFALLLTTFLAWKILRAPSTPANRWLQASGLPLLAAAPILLFSFWYLHQTGSPIPLTGVAKRYFFAEDHWPLFRKIKEEYSQLILLAGAAGPLILTLPRIARFPLGRVLLLAMLLFAAALFVQFPGQLAVNEFRYPVVLIPMLLWGLGMILKNAEPQKRPSAEKLMYVCALYALGMLPMCWHFYRDERIFFEAGPRQVTTWCQQNLAPGSAVLVHDAGYLAFSTGFRNIDFVGLKTPSAIPLNRQYTWPTAGGQRAQVVARLAAESGSRYLIINSHWPPVVSLDKELRSLGWRVDLVHAAGAFKIYRISPPQ
jgi:hypothetical protein